MATNNKVTNVGEGTREWWKEWGTGLDNLNQAKWDPSALYREQEIAQQSLSNQMLSNQATALDTIRKANASAIASGANAGLSAANQLSSVLGLQQETAQASTELANRHITEAISGEQATLANFRELLNTGAAMLQSEAAMGDVESRNLAYAAEALNEKLKDKKLSESKRREYQEDLDNINKRILNIKESNTTGTNTTVEGEVAPTVNDNVIPEITNSRDLSNAIINNEELNTAIRELDTTDAESLQKSLSKGLLQGSFDKYGKRDQISEQREVLNTQISNIERIVGESNLNTLKEEYDYFNKLSKPERDRMTPEDKAHFEAVVSIYSNYAKLKKVDSYLKDRHSDNAWGDIADDWKTSFSAFDDGYQIGDVTKAFWKAGIVNPLKTLGNTIRGLFGG